LAVKLRQIGGQADVREPRRNAGAERSNWQTRLFDRVPQDVFAGFSKDRVLAELSEFQQAAGD